MKFNKVIIWGHKLYSHTHSFVHQGFYKAFKELGYDTYWLDDRDDILNMNFDNCLFLTEGCVDKNMPKPKNAKYILHNCDGKYYSEIDNKNKINMQFFHIDVLKYGDLTKINDYTFVGSDIVYQPWATDLLPREIDENEARNEIDNRECFWIGSFDEGNSQFQNHTELDPFFNECKKNNIKIRMISPWSTPVSPEENKKLINGAYLAPAINGIWQKSTFYLPCRVFKHISYGHICITNNSYVDKIFDGKVVYDSDPTTLFYKALAEKSNPNAVNNIKTLMNEVKEKHTYINRTNQLLSLL